MSGVLLVDNQINLNCGRLLRLRGFGSALPIASRTILRFVAIPELVFAADQFEQLHLVSLVL